MMPNEYQAYLVNETSDYVKFRNAALYEYKPQENYIRCGSGGDVNAELVKEASLDPWAVSRLGGQIQGIRTKIESYGGWNVLVLDSGQQTEPVVTTKNKLDDIRGIFGISVSHLAKVLLTSRPSLHSWLDGSIEPRDQSIQRINQIYQFARTWKSKSGFHYSPGRLMRQPLGDGPSMLTRLERNHFADAEIQDGLERLLQLMQRQRIQMDAAKEKSARADIPEHEQEKARRQLTTNIFSK